MKIAYFNDWRLGIVKGDAIVDVMAAVSDVPRLGPHDLINGVIERWSAYKPKVEDAAAKGASIPLGSVKLRAPLPRPVNIDCMAVNYMEDGTRKEAAPINAFHKSPNSIIGPDEAMVLPDVPTSVFEGEAELAVIIGKKGFNIKAADAMSHVFGYCNFIDGSARGLPPAGNTFYQMKSRETFAPIGPWIVTADEIEDPHNLAIKLWNNGDLKQSFNTSDMAHKIPRSIEFVSSLHTLMPGDILASGTNHRGLHAFQDGNRIELEVEGCGKLRITVSDSLKRTWPRETRLQRQDQGHEPLAPQASGKYAKA